MGYKSEITINGEMYQFDFDAITDEGDGPTYFTAAHSSHHIFRNLETWQPMGVREFVRELKTILDAEMNKDTTVTESVEILDNISDERIISVWASTIGGNQPDIKIMRKDIQDLMKRDSITFIEIEKEIDLNN